MQILYLVRLTIIDNYIYVLVDLFLIPIKGIVVIKSIVIVMSGMEQLVCVEASRCYTMEVNKKLVLVF